MPTPVPLPPRRTLLKALLAAPFTPFMAPVLATPAGAQPSIGPRAASALGVLVRNQSTAPSCAGPENLVLTFVSEAVRRLHVEARHPAFTTALASDADVPSYLGCPTDPAAPMPPVAQGADGQVLLETAELRVSGHGAPDFWRPATVPVRVGDKRFEGFGRVALAVKRDGAVVPVLELFPGDGSWRLRPLPPPHLGHTAFGAAVLIGPVAQERQVLVKLASVAIAPDGRGFTLRFADGGSAQVTLAGADRQRLALDATFAQPVTAPFAALRAHYVMQGEADITRLAWRTGTSAPLGEAPVMSFTDTPDVTLLWAGRLTPTRPAPTAPDLVFSGFAGG